MKTQEVMVPKATQEYLYDSLPLSTLILMGLESNQYKHTPYMCNYISGLHFGDNRLSYEKREEHKATIEGIISKHTTLWAFMTSDELKANWPVLAKEGTVGSFRNLCNPASKHLLTYARFQFWLTVIEVLQEKGM